MYVTTSRKQLRFHIIDYKNITYFKWTICMSEQGKKYEDSNEKINVSNKKKISLIKSTLCMTLFLMTASPMNYSEQKLLIQNLGFAYLFLVIAEILPNLEYFLADNELHEIKHFRFHILPRIDYMMVKNPGMMLHTSQMHHLNSLHFAIYLL